MGEKTVVLDAAKTYTVWEFEDRAISEGKNQDLLREVKKILVIVHMRTLNNIRY